MNRYHFNEILHKGANNSKLITVGRKKKQHYHKSLYLAKMLPIFRLSLCY